MKQSIFLLTENETIAPNVYRMQLMGDTSQITAPGQFVNLRLDGKYLRRPISVCCLVGDTLTLIYKVVGGGTAQMAALQTGERLDLLTGLGNGYDLSVSGDHPLLLGGGVGIPPLFWLAKQLLDQGKQVTAVLGFNTREEIFLENEFRQIGAEVIVATADGSYGTKGFVADAMPGEYSYFYTCGPEPMLRAVYKSTSTSGQFSFEERMGCGFGACMGCSCKTVTGFKRICKDGPVLRKEEILWNA